MSASSEAFLNSPASSGSSSSYKGRNDHFLISNSKAPATIAILYSFALATFSLFRFSWHLSPSLSFLANRMNEIPPSCHGSTRWQRPASAYLTYLLLKQVQEYMQILCSSFDQVSQRRTDQTRFNSNKEVKHHCWSLTDYSVVIPLDLTTVSRFPS